MTKAKIYVTLKESVLDPQGQAVQSALHSMNYTSVNEVRVGKYMEVTLEETGQDAHEKIKQMCEKLLSNPVIEDYEYELEEA
ncbi:phosphoribosylformylglycinamidine synthase subunit PurS [Bacillaceae bacterium SIJ1]|uniref:phosphoribosylformylglycinamidine synthase subunit PurS n=1 Tax=Litoribacterium kuwaitense TaxID=1398745 RepID=UPI0013ED1483|nr:phosphoribosylformylglycinamidine synthase subunit PurS [Litoribacterium kuwaitense]NGP46069.1 phosphoribosylformylglycinamidine synthase subunit PurS [Litoribacterium kuwaitense]